MKTKTIFTCTGCDAQSPAWSGRCLECGKWGTIKEESGGASEKKAPGKISNAGKPGKTVSLKDLKGSLLKRIPSGIGELDRVLGGGFVPGSVTLFSGEPGVGKSTLLLQAAARLKNTLYISGEESSEQIALRFERLKLSGSDLSFLPETNLSTILATIESEKPALVIIDSIQTTFVPEVESEFGSVTQIRSVTSQLMELAKRYGVDFDPQYLWS